MQFDFSGGLSSERRMCVVFPALPPLSQMTSPDRTQPPCRVYCQEFKPILTLRGSIHSTCLNENIPHYEEHTFNSSFIRGEGAS